LPNVPPCRFKTTTPGVPNYLLDQQHQALCSHSVVDVKNHLQFDAGRQIDQVAIDPTAFDRNQIAS